MVRRGSEVPWCAVSLATSIEESPQLAINWVTSVCAARERRRVQDEVTFLVKNKNE